MSQLGIATAGLDATGDDTYNTVVQYREEQASEFIRIYIFLLVYLKYYSYSVTVCGLVWFRIRLFYYNIIHCYGLQNISFFFHHEFLW